MKDLTGRIALVTGGSRGVGARTAALLARAGADVAVTYRNKAARAEEVVAEIEVMGRRGLAAEADMTSREALAALAERVREQFGRLDLLVLNASGGMEKDKPAEYALRLNRDAQMQAADALLPLMPPGARIVFVTSHPAHFYPEKPVYPAYEAVAASKRAGEDALRARIPALSARGIDLVVVSGDLIEGTITAKLLDRSSPGLIETRRAQAGFLPSVEGFAQAIADAARDETLTSGATVYVGNTE